jgi:hypothetical protein
MAVVRRFFESRGHELVDGVVEKVDPDAVEMRDGGRLQSALTAVVGPLSGGSQGLPPDLLGAGGFVAVDPPGDGVLPKSWVMARLEARTVAANMLATLHGRGLTPFDTARALRRAISMPDVGGTTVVVRNKRLLVHGRWPLALRSWMDRRYIGSHSK